MRRFSFMFVRRFLLVLVCTACALIGAAQDKSQKAPDAGPIQDNSFLMEEAYNQEPAVVQHISTFLRRVQSHDWAYSFTQEWPVNGIKNQFSYTLAAAHSGSVPGSGSGIGDVALNYRYQLVGSGETRVAIAPRISVLL